MSMEYGSTIYLIKGFFDSTDHKNWSNVYTYMMFLYGETCLCELAAG